MTSRRFYAFTALAFLLGLFVIVSYPEPSLLVLTVLVPLSLIGAAVALGYLWWVYRRQPIPRSRFYKMLLETFASLLILGGWVAYLTVARLLMRAALEGPVPFLLPAPPPTISAPISALLVIAVFAAPSRFAIDVFAIRRRRGAPATADDDVTSNHSDIL